MTKSELKKHVNATGSYFFDAKTMRFFGDTMANYALKSKPVEILNSEGEIVKVWALSRKKPVKHDLQNTKYFDVNTYKKVLPKQVFTA